MFISGYRKDDFEWLASDERGRPLGVIELGVTPHHKLAFYNVRDQLETGEDRDFVFLEPRLKAKVKIRNWTKAGMLRSPSFVEFVL